MTTKKAAKKKAAKRAVRIMPDRIDQLESKLNGLIAYLKAHGIDYDGSAAPEEAEAEPEEKAE